jgi:adenosine deaminase
MDWNEFPKVELHLHLDCSLSYSVVSRLNPAITHAEFLESFIVPAGCPSMAAALSCAAREIELMQTEEALRLVTSDLFEQMQQDSMLYAEIRFAPLLHTAGGLSPEKVVSIVDTAVQKASRDTGIEARVLLCTLRNYSEAQSLETVQLVEQFGGTSVVGFDIAGDEVGFPVDAHIPAFRYARAHDIPCTAHAGEARGSESVWETLQHLTPLRIGHGVHSIGDPALLEHLRRRQIHLEVCPTSNVHVYHQVFETYSDHPIDSLYSSGISLGVNSDSRTLIPVTPTQEYERLHQAFGWGKEQFLQCNLNALRSAFIPEPVKQQLIDRLLEAYRVL